MMSIMFRLRTFECVFSHHHHHDLQVVVVVADVMHGADEGAWDADVHQDMLYWPMRLI